MEASSRSPAGELVPVAPQERVQLYDVLRGFCLFGVLWSNLNDWYIAAKPVTPIDHALSWTQGWLLESRFYSILGLLFGIGFAIQLTRAAQRGQDVRSLFYRRMSVLLVFGMLHGMLIWQGDILTSYALLGFVLVPFRRLSPRKLLIAAASLVSIVPYVINHVVAWLGWRWAPGTWQEAVWIYGHGTWGQIVVTGARQYLFWLGRFPLFIYPSFLALFVLGLWAIRVDLHGRLTRRPELMLWALAGALLVWGASQYVQINIAHWWPAGLANQAPDWHVVRFWSARHTVLRLLSLFATWGNACVYALILALAISVRRLSRVLQPLADLGRMTLTTYLTQSVISTAMFYHWGLGWITRSNYSSVLVITVVVFSLQIAFSVWWLKHYRFGPAEWLWRSLAYGRRLPLRVSSQSHRAALAPTS